MRKNLKTNKKDTDFAWLQISWKTDLEAKSWLDEA